MNKIYRIPRTLANRLLTLAQNTPDTEICGLIAEQDNQYSVYPISNVADNRQCAFEMQPQQQIEAFKVIREKQQNLFAIFHSHPHSAALPSKKDLSDAAYTDDVLNIIISLSTKGVLDMRGYLYNDSNSETVNLLIE